jgi:hypothetical protein
LDFHDLLTGGLRHEAPSHQLFAIHLALDEASAAVTAPSFLR